MKQTRNIFLKDGYVVLRPVEKQDAEFIRETRLHEEVRPHIGNRPLPIRPTNMKQEESFIEEMCSDDNIVTFLIEYKQEKTGVIVLRGLSNEYGRTETGYYIHPDHQNQGIGTKSLQTVVKYTFETLNRDLLRAGYLEGNEASRRVMEKSGFRKEGRERRFKYVNGQWKDRIMMSITQEEYLNQKQKPV